MALPALVTPLLPDPEERWRRIEDLPRPSARRLAQWLGDWPELAARRWSVLGGGLRSLHLRSGDLVARIALAPGHDLEKEADVLELVAGDLRVPPLLRRGKRALLFAYVEHERVPANAEAGRAVGRAAARIHAHRFQGAGLLGPGPAVVRPFETALAGLRHWIGGVLDVGRAGEAPGLEGLEDAVRALWEREASRMEEAAAEPVLVHADFKPANLRWLPEERDALVFDWDFAWSGPALMDLGQLLRWNPPRAFVRGLAAGYRAAGGRLPLDWQRLAGLFDLFNLVAFAVQRRDDPVRSQDVRARIRQTLAAG